MREEPCISNMVWSLTSSGADAPAWAEYWIGAGVAGVLGVLITANLQSDVTKPHGAKRQFEREARLPPPRIETAMATHFLIQTTRMTSHSMTLGFCSTKPSNMLRGARAARRTR